MLGLGLFGRTVDNERAHSSSRSIAQSWLYEHSDCHQSRASQHPAHAPGARARGETTRGEPLVQESQARAELDATAERLRADGPVADAVLTSTVPGEVADLVLKVARDNGF